MKRLLILNGINLDRLGTREIDIYGTISFQDYFVELQKKFSDVELVSFQSDRLDDITDKLLKSENFDGIILNAGAYTHSSLVLADTIKSISTRVVEVHISNLFGREQYRKNSHFAGVCLGFISVYLRK